MRFFIPTIQQVNYCQEYERLRLSYSLSKEGYFDEAVSELSTVLGQNPKSIYVHLALGNIYILQKRYSDALTHFHILNELDPLAPLGSTKLGTTYLKQGQIDQALNCLNWAVSLDQKAVSARTGLGQAYMAKHWFEQAILCFHQALNLDSESILAYILLSDVYERQKNLEMAIFYVEQALQMKPRLLLGHIKMGWILLTKKYYQASQEAFQRALDLNPQSIDAKMGFAETLIATNRLKEAIQISEEIAQIGKQSATRSTSMIDFLEQASFMQVERFNETSSLDLWLFSLALAEQEQYLSD